MADHLYNLIWSLCALALLFASVVLGGLLWELLIGETYAAIGMGLGVLVFIIDRAFSLEAIDAFEADD